MRSFFVVVLSDSHVPELKTTHGVSVSKYYVHPKKLQEIMLICSLFVQVKITHAQYKTNLIDMMH